jgi:hypothetical protein
VTKFLAGVLVTLVTLVLLLLAVYTLRLTPEVVNGDRGRQSVEVQVTNASADSDTGVVRDKFLGCNVWYHVQDIEDILWPARPARAHRAAVAKRAGASSSPST